jgi:hypothetical protein
VERAYKQFQHNDRVLHNVARNKNGIYIDK